MYSRFDLVLIFVIVYCVGSFVVCYNVDTARVIKHQGPRGSMFGFTVAPHSERGANMILVGAPKANTSQPNVTEGGAVYRCDISRNGYCDQIAFDRTGDYHLRGKVIDQKSRQWFGASLHSAGRGGPVVACASRYVWFNSKYDRRDPVGTCYVARNYFSEFSEYSPCRTGQWGFHRQGTCQAGFSAAISKDGNNLFVGAPGSCYWQGRMYSIDATSQFPYKPPFFAPYGQGRLTSQSLHKRPGAFHSKDGTVDDDDSYIGYSIAVGNFTGKGQEGIAAGMPRGAGLLGRVLLYTWNMTNFVNITGRQMGSYFGYAVAAADVDGDRYDDLVIGAPLFTTPNNEGKYEVGKVYVVYQRSEQGRFMKVDEIDGTNSKSRFGLSLTSLGDINLDGFIDFAVGAPYDGPFERGAVYIFHGSASGVQTKYTQVIYAEEVGPIPPSTFGFSVSGGLDLDNNDYPDTVIGAYESDTAFFLRSKPVVKVTGYAQFRTANKEIALEDKNCHIRTKDGRVAVACAYIDTCLNYTGVGVPRDISLELQFTLDTLKEKNIRMFFLDNEIPGSNVWKGTWRLYKDGTSKCSERMVYIKEDIRDKLTPLDVEVKYSMDAQYAYRDLAPVLDLTSKALRKDSVSIRKNCGDDNVCVPNLSLDITPNVERYLLASNEVLFFDIVVGNKGEDSFETTFSVQIPEDVNFTKIEDSGDVKISCREISINHTILCDIGNPLPAKKIVNFKMYFKPHYKEGMKRFYVFNMEVDSANPEDNSTIADNKKKIKLPIWVNSKLELKGGSRPSPIRYNFSYYAEKEHVKHEREIGPQVIHLYTITNNGPSAINQAEVLIFWPYATASGDDLMYLLDPPHVLGNVRCEGAAYNYQAYRIEKRNKTIWEAFDLDVSKEETYRTSEITKAEGGIYIEQNEKKVGASSDEKLTLKNDLNSDKFEKATGDASDILTERDQQRSKQQSTIDGRGILVTSGGQGSKVVTKTETFTNTSSGPTGGVYTYTKNTTLTFGPHGEVIRNETSSYGGKQDLRRGSSQSGSQISKNRGSVRVGDEVYETPYSSVEYEVSEPTNSAHNRRYDNQYRDNYHRQYDDDRFGGQNTAHGYQSKTYNRTHDVNYAQPPLNAEILSQGAKVGFYDLGVVNKDTDEELLNKQGEFYDSKTQQGSYEPVRNKIGYNAPVESGYKSYSEERSGNFDGGNRNYHSQSHWSRQHTSDGRTLEEPRQSNDRDRKKRQTKIDDDLTKEVDCKATDCKYLRCYVGPMAKDEDATIAIRGRVNVTTIKNISSTQNITFSTVMVGRIISVPFIGVPSETETVRYEVTSTVIAPEEDTKEDIVPLWVVVLSAIAGALILLLLIFLFYKCGFFKRNRPSNVPERQPLNRNGHYASGDEAL